MWRKMVYLWLALFFIYGTLSQRTDFKFDCPSNWFTFENSCYQFYSNRKLSFEDARIECGMHGAGLLSVSSRSEHGFITRWLQKYDIDKNQWYTSGIREGSRLGERLTKFVWQGTGEELGDASVQFWEPGTNTKVPGVIVYSSSNASYSWTLEDPSEKLAYICEVPEDEAYRIIQEFRDYDYGTDTTDVNKLERGPHFISLPHSTVVVGDPPTIEVECVASGKPEPTYSWWKGENFDQRLLPSVNSRYTVTNGKLIIENPHDKKDNGMYRCQAENKFGVIVSHGIRLTFGHIGEFSNVPDAPVMAKAYEGAAVDCSRITFKPAVKYSWFKQSTDRVVRPQYQKYMFMSQNGKLYFSEATVDDEGQYYCVAVLTGVNRYTIGTFQPPTRMSLPIQLVIRDSTPKADWGPEIQDEFIGVYPKPPLVGQDVRLECFAYGSATTEFLYSWSRHGKELPTNAVLEDNNRVLILHDAKLENQGVYTCYVSRGTSARDQKSIDLRLGAKPYFITSIGDQHADIGSRLTWRCNARASPAASFRWLKNGKLLVTDEEQGIVVINNVLVISKLDPVKHNGMYQCWADNTHGSSLSEGQLRVLSFAPNFNKYPLYPNSRAVANGNFTIHCRPEGAPLPHITWFKNGVEIPENADRMRQYANGRLRIFNVQRSDAGKYTCRAENVMGVMEDHTNVVIAAGTAITLGPSDEKVLVNTTVFFPCHASYAKNTDMVYIWRFNGVQINVHRHHEFTVIQDANNGNTGLYIRPVTVMNSGYYECEALTTLNSDISGAYLYVIAPPSEPSGIFVDTSTVTNSSVKIGWTDGFDHGRAITHYIIEAANAYESDRWEVAIANLPVAEAVRDEYESKAVVVTGLYPGCGYRLRVISVNSMGLSTPSAPSVYIHTHSAPPTLPPTNVGGGGGSVGDLTMRWTPLTRPQQGGGGIGYRLYWREKKETVLEPDDFSFAEIKGSEDHFVYLVGADKYYLPYEFKIQAFNNKGFGPNSSLVEIMSAEDLPIATPTNVAADGYNGTAMFVEWTPVPQIREYAKGKILGYQINYWHEEEVATDYKEFIRHEGQVDNGIVIGLKSDNFYFFTIQVYNSAGLGPISEFFFQETLHAPASQYPEEIRVFSAGRNRAEIWWRGIHITQPEANVHGFVIYYWPANEHYRTACHFVVHDHHAHHAIIDIEPGTVYAVRVSAYSDGGYGKKSLTTYFTLEGTNIIVDHSLAETVEAFISSARTPSYSLSPWMGAAAVFVIIWHRLS